MRRKWKNLFGVFLLTAGLLAGCAEKPGQPLQEAQDTGIHSAEEPSAGTQDAEEQGTGTQGAEEQGTGIQSAEEQSTEEQSTEEQSTEEQSAEEQSTEEQSAEEQSTEEQSTEESNAGIQSAEEPSADAQTAEVPLSEDGTYTSKEEVAEYIALYGHLPDNFITKNEAKALGWVSSKGNLGEVAPGKSIGGDYFGNFEGHLPEKKGRDYHECDIDSTGGYRGAKRIVYSNDGLIYYTEDHYETFELLYGEE